MFCVTFPALAFSYIFRLILGRGICVIAGRNVVCPWNTDASGRMSHTIVSYIFQYSVGICAYMPRRPCIFSFKRYSLVQ